MRSVKKLSPLTLVLRRIPSSKSAVERISTKFWISTKLSYFVNIKVCNNGITVKCFAKICCFKTPLIIINWVELRFNGFAGPSGKKRYDPETEFGSGDVQSEIY